MPTYTLIARKEESEYWCCGSRDEHYYGDFSLTFYTKETLHELIDQWALYRRINQTELGRSETGWECTLLIDGLNESWAQDIQGCEQEEFEEIYNLVSKRFDTLMVEWNESLQAKKLKKEQAKVEQAQKAAADKEAKEYAEYKRLHDKFGSV